LQNQSATSTIEIKQAEIEECLPVHVGEILKNKPGFTQKSEYQVPLIFRGLSGKRILVLRNGNRRFSSYPAGFMSQTINIYDLNRIEIEKGAASVLYGAGAIAGIINLIDKSPFDQQGFTGSIATGYATNNREKSVLVSSGWSTEKIALKTNLRYRSADNFTYSDGAQAENSFYKDKDFFLTAAYKITPDQCITLSSDIHRGGPWGKPKGFSGTDYLNATVNIENNCNISLNYLLNDLGIMRYLDLSLFYTSEERELEKIYVTAADKRLSFKEKTQFSDNSYGVKLFNTLDLSSTISTQTGFELYNFNISTPVQSIDYIQKIAYDNRVSKNANSLTTGAFIEATSYATKHLKFLGGIRYDWASISEGDFYSTKQAKARTISTDALSATMGVRITTSDNTKLKINSARAFRMPEIQELFTDNYSSNGIIYGNPALKPEYSNCLDASFTALFTNFEVEISPFIWLMKDMVSKIEFKGQPGLNYQYINIGKTRLWGGEVSVTLPLRELLTSDDKLALTTALSYENGTDVTESNSFTDIGEPLSYVPPFNIKTEMSYHCTIRKNIQFNCAIQGTYYSEQKRLPPDGYATPAFFIADGNIGVVFKKKHTKPTIRIALNNLFNTHYYSYYSFLPGKGRDIKLFLSTDLH
jgi:outer membrane receptor protein involved in Fe transport